MATGFVYVVPTVGKDYLQPNLQCVPTWLDGCIYFGPCKKPMRPRMKPGDSVFGISPASTLPRRVVFTGTIAERMSFAEAYKRYSKLRGPDGPIHVRPTETPGDMFPDSVYEHIPGANHSDNWRRDIRTPNLDAFFVCVPAAECVGRWLGPAGPVVTGDIFTFLKSCAVYGNAGLLSERNAGASEKAPVRHGGLYCGLHLETDAPERLLKLICGTASGMSEAEALERQFHTKVSSNRKTERKRCAC